MDEAVDWSHLAPSQHTRAGACGYDRSAFKSYKYANQQHRQFPP